MKLTNLFISLMILAILDTITTYIAIQFYGGIELNPLYVLCGSLMIFLTVKIILTTNCLYIIYYLRRTHYKMTFGALLLLNILYSGVIISNINQLYQIL